MNKKKCKCGTEFTQYTSMQSCCIQCAIDKGKNNTEKARKSDIRERKAKLKSRQDWLREAQAIFNKFIRLRDKDLPCISCSRFHQGQNHASHYRSVGACSSLRFNELNVHKSCSVCNTMLSGNIMEYRIALKKKIGPDKVEWLECQPKCRKWTIDEIKAIIKKYRKLCKNLEG